MAQNIPAPLSVSQDYQRIENFLQVWRVLDLTGMVVLEAIRGARDYQFNFWDAQIWAAARLNQIPAVFSKDFGSGTLIEGVRFVNPFAENFWA